LTLNWPSLFVCADGQSEKDCGAFAFFAFNPNPAPVQLNQVLADVQSEA